MLTILSSMLDSTCDIYRYAGRGRGSTYTEPKNMKGRRVTAFRTENVLWVKFGGVVSESIDRRQAGEIFHLSQYQRCRVLDQVRTPGSADQSSRRHRAPGTV